MIEDKLDALTAAIVALTQALTATPVAAQPTTTPLPADDNETAPPKKTRKKKAAKVEEPAAPTLEVVPEAQPEPVAEPEPAPVIEELPPLSKEEVGLRLREISQKLGDPQALVAILADLGAERLSEVDPKDYQTLMNKADALVATNA